jgi:RecA-family ATPase
MDLDSDDLRLPASAVIDHEHGARQASFRKRGTGVAPRFRNPDDLARLVERSLRELETRQRIDKRLEDERQPVIKPPVRAEEFINPPPVTAPTWFQDRIVETGLIAKWLTDPGTRVITVIGRGGMGKTAMVCRLLKSLEAGQLPDLDQQPATMEVGGIVYLSGGAGPHPVTYLNLVQDLCQLLPEEAATTVRVLYQDPHNPPERVIRALLEHLPSEGAR